MSQEQKDKISKANSGKNHWLYGKKMPEAQRQKIADSLKGATHGYKKDNVPWMLGRKHTDETKRKVSEAKKGVPSTSSTKFQEGHSPWNTGKKRSKEFVQNMKKRIANLNDFSGWKGTHRHKTLVDEITSEMKEHSNNVKTEERVVMKAGNWRYIDVLVDDTKCYEIGYCKKEKILDLTDNGYEVIHLPYSVLGGEQS